MTKKDFLQKRDEIKSQMTNLYGAEYDAKMRELNMLQVEFNTEQSCENAPEKKTLVGLIRESIGSNNKKIKLHSCVQSREGEIVKSAHTTGVEIEGLLEPLYTNSVLNKLGARFYTGMPQGDICISIMDKGSVGWADEVAKANVSGQIFSHITLKPKRLTAYIDISKAFLFSDTIEAEESIRRDLINAISDKFESTIFGYGAVSTTQPGGMFNGKLLANANTFAKVTSIEASVEENNVSGEKKYLLSPKAKADLRVMAKSNKNTQLVFENGFVDGVEAFVSNNVKDAVSTVKGCYIYGDFSNLAVGIWGDVDITVDEYSQAVKGCVRLVINSYLDAKVLRDGAFAYGDTRATD